MADTFSRWLGPITEIAKEAGGAIRDIYQANTEIVVAVKQDGSPLTKADRIANDIITQKLALLTPELPVLSEESTDVPFSERVRWRRYWLVDPLDGTKEFIQRTGDFTVNIALIEAHHPIMSVVYAPMQELTYFACKDQGAYKCFRNETPTPIHAQAWKGGHLRVVTSRRHGTEELKPFLEKLHDVEIVLLGSSLKFCLVAEGSADIYPRLGLTSEWDTAAAQCIVEEAGGAVIDLHGLRLQYNTRDSLLNPHFLVVGDNQHPWAEWASSSAVVCKGN